jgi:hypothetical protein
MNALHDFMPGSSIRSMSVSASAGTMERCQALRATRIGWLKKARLQPN